jgi:hypothetical protein
MGWGQVIYALTMLEKYRPEKRCFFLGILQRINKKTFIYLDGFVIM